MMISSTTLKKFIEMASQELAGEWLILGGTVLPLLGARNRATVDIDFVGLGKKERAQQLELMRLTEKLGLPIEAINSAASLFVDRALKNKSDLIVLAQGKKAVIYRPSTQFYFRLKLARLSESDLSDCMAWLEFFREEITKKDRKAIAALVAKELKGKNITPEKLANLKKLKTVV